MTDLNNMPLHFWFNNDIRLSIPLIAYQYHTINQPIYELDFNINLDKFNLDKFNLDKFIYTFDKNNNLINQLNKFNMTECPISLNTFIDNQLIIILDCNHIFDYISFKEWYKMNNKCPVCRSRILIN
jgi:hypothetical protein